MGFGWSLLTREDCVVHPSGAESKLEARHWSCPSGCSKRKTTATGRKWKPKGLVIKRLWYKAGAWDGTCYGKLKMDPFRKANGKIPVTVGHWELENKRQHTSAHPSPHTPPHPQTEELSSAAPQWAFLEMALQVYWCNAVGWGALGCEGPQRLL